MHFIRSGEREAVREYTPVLNHENFNKLFSYRPIHGGPLGSDDDDLTAGVPPMKRNAKLAVR